MPDLLRTTISQFSSSGGRWQPRAANVRAVEPAPDLPSAERGSLYLLIEVSGSGGGHVALYRQMLNAAQVAFYEKGDTVEAALRQAVRSAHSVLRDANEGLPEAAWRAGISLVVRFANNLTIAQAGAGLVLVSHPKTVDQFPAEMGDWGAPLGGEVRPEVKIYDTTVEPGSTVLLAQSDWSQHVASEALAVAAAAPNVSLASQYLGQLAGNAELTALLVGFGSTIPELQEDLAVRPWVLPGPSGGPDEPAAGAGKTERGPGKGVFRVPGPGRLFGMGRTAEEQPAAAPPEPELGEHADRPQAGQQPAAREVVAAGRPVPAAPSGADVSPGRTEAALEPSPAARAPAPAGARAVPRGRGPWPLIALGIIPLLIVGVVVVMLLMRSKAANVEFQQFLQGASSVITEVEGLPDEAGAQRLNAARDFLDQARARRPEDAELAKLEQRYQVLFDKVQHVIPLYGIVPIWRFDEVGHSPTRVLANGDGLFVLDSGLNQVNRFNRSPLGDSVTSVDKPVVRKGDQIGGAVVSDLLDIVWAEAAGPNQRSKLLVLDTSGGLISFDPTWGIDRPPLGGRDKLKRPQLATGYGGNLYIVDQGANQIWRYRPGAKGYEGDPEPYFAAGKQPDMTGVQAMAIDGNIWLLFADGRLLKFFAGEQRSFDFQGMPSKLSAPAALAVPLEGDHVYILDTGNARIVETTKEGQFLRQFRAREGDSLRTARSLFLDEANAKFYIVTPDQLHVADVPGPAAAASIAAPAATPTPAQ